MQKIPTKEKDVFSLLLSPVLAYKNDLAITDNLCRELGNPNSFFLFKLLIYCYIIFNIRSVCAGRGGHIHVYTRDNNIEKKNVQVREAILFDRRTATCL